MDCGFFNPLYLNMIRLFLYCRALRQVYMRSGGSHPAIVARMIDLQAEAQVLEKRQPAAAGRSESSEG